MRRKIFIAIVGLLSVVLAAAGYAGYTLWRHEVFVPPDYDEAPLALPELVGEPRVLVFSKTNSFRHVDAIPAANAMFEDLSRAHGWTLFFTENAGVHTPENLARFALVIWNNVSGDVLTEAQRGAFQAYLEGGGRVLGMHATGGDPFYAWKWHPVEFIRAQFKAHPGLPQFQNAEVVVEDKDHPAMKHLPERWAFKDEWYSFVATPRERVNVLASLDESTYTPALVGPFGDLRMGDHPVIWHHSVGEGKVFYSALGHRAEAYADVHYREVLEQACLWLMAPESVPDRP